MLKHKHKLDEAGLFFIEGKKFVSEIPDDWDIVSMIYSESYSLKNDTEAYRGERITIGDAPFARLSETVTPQGIMAVCRKKTYDADAVLSKKNALIVYAEEINDPGNLGTMIRTAHACGADGVFCSENSAGAYNPKALRASAGSFFHVPVVEGMDLSEFAGKLRLGGIKTAAAHTGGRECLYDMDFTHGAAIIIGSEARGLSDTAIGLADHLIYIPMPGGAESLNASAACAVILYEAVRQRLACDTVK